MEDKKNLLRNIIIVAGFLAAVAAGFAIRAGLPQEYSRYSGLVFFGSILLIGGLAGFIASRFIK